MEDWKNGGFGLYLHWPFCASKCPYCDFNSHVAASIDQERWKRAYLSEIARIGAETSGRVLNTVFFGGGTPSLMNPDVVAALIEAIRMTCCERPGGDPGGKPRQRRGWPVPGLFGRRSQSPLDGCPGAQ